MCALLSLIVRAAYPEEVHVFAGLGSLSLGDPDPSELQEMLDHVDLLLAARTTVCDTFGYATDSRGARNAH